MRGRLRLIFRAFRYRNYRLFFMGQTLSLVGTWMQLIAVGWLVYRLTGSALQLGVVSFAGQIATLILPPFAGVLADRMNRRRLLIWTQSLYLVQALLLSFLVFSGTVRIWQVALLSLMNGIINSFDMPIRHSFVADLIEEREDFSNAIPLNSAMFNAARLVGPSLAGILISRFGEGVCFLINAASYIAVLSALLAMGSTSTPPARNSGKKVVAEISDGFRYAIGFFPIWTLLLLLCLFSVAAMPYMTLLPAFVRDVLHGTSRDYGFIVTASGIGCLICNIFFASRRNAAGLSGLIPVACIAAVACLAALSLSRNLLQAFIVVLFLGGFMMAHLTASNVLLQTVVDEDKRGRVMSLYIMSFIGMIPVGSLVSGICAEYFGVSRTIQAGACCCLAGVLLFVAGRSRFHAELQPVLERLGIVAATSGRGQGRGCQGGSQDRAV